MKIVRPTGNYKYITDGSIVAEVVNCPDASASRWHNCSAKEKEEIEARQNAATIGFDEESI